MSTVTVYMRNITQTFRGLHVSSPEQFGHLKFFAGLFPSLYSLALNGIICYKKIYFDKY
jgi:hypothetical protein